MKKNLFLIPFLILTLSCSKESKTNSAEDGHEQGNGYEDHLSVNDMNAWVAGSENEIKYCILYSNNFGVDETTIIQTLDTAFSTWKNYIVSKKVNESLSKSFLKRWEIKPGPEAEEKAKLMHVVTKSKLLPACDGSENIKFLFGVTDPRISSQIKSGTQEAFVLRTEYNEATGLGKGLIWINKNESGLWQRPNRLLSVLLHEIGHTYGQRHTPQTIMDGSATALIYGANKTAVFMNHLTSIDHEAELFSPDLTDSETNYKGTLTDLSKDLPKNETDSEITNNFISLTGRSPVGEVSSAFKFPKVIISDEQSTFEFNIIHIGKNTSIVLKDSGFITVRFWRNDPLFITGVDSKGSFGNGYAYALTKSTITTAEIENSNGLRLPIIVEQNMGQQMKISYILNGEKSALMYTFHPSYWK